jgi:hypothetical protein
MFSCARLEITGGDPNQQCQPWRTIPVPQCQKAAGPPAARLLRRSSLGSFCYGSSNQTVMSENIRFADTINSLCDPRLSCDLALDRSQCLRDRFDQSTKCASNVLEPDTSVISIASDDVTAIEVPVESEQPFPAGPPNTTSDRSICLDGNNSWAYWNGSAWSIEKCSQKTKCFRDQSGFSRCVMDNTFGKSRQPIDTATWIGYRVLLNGTEHEQFVIRFEISTARDFDKWQMKLKLSDAATISQIPGVSWTQQGQIVFLEQSAANIKSYSVNNQDRFKFLLVGEGRVPMIRQLLFGTRLFRPPPRRFLVRYVIKERLQLQNTFQSDIYILPDDNICRSKH